MKQTRTQKNPLVETKDLLGGHVVWITMAKEDTIHLSFVTAKKNLLKVMPPLIYNLMMSLRCVKR